MLDHGPDQGRRAISLVPDLHVCIVDADQVVADVPDAIALLDPARPLPGSAARRPPATSSSTGSRASTARARCTSSWSAEALRRAVGAADSAPWQPVGLTAAPPHPTFDPFIGAEVGGAGLSDSGHGVETAVTQRLRSPESFHRLGGFDVPLALAQPRLRGRARPALPAAPLTIDPAYAARGSRAPATAPTLLVVDDQAAPLDAASTPRFGWLPQDVDANEVQTAYKIEVRDAGGVHRLGHRQGEVLAQQAYVDYAGRRLDRGVPTRGGCGPGTRTSSLPVVGLGVVRDRASVTTTGATPRGSGGRRATRTPARSASSTAGAASTAATSRSPRPARDWTDYVVTMDVTPVTRAAAVVFRAPDSNNGYMWQLHATDNALKTHRMVGGAFPTDARRTVPHVIDTGRHLRAEHPGRRARPSGPASTAQVVDTWTDPSATGSRAGTIGFREASGELADFDDIRVTSLDGSPCCSRRTSRAASTSGSAAPPPARPTSTPWPAPWSTSRTARSSAPGATSLPATPPSSTSTASAPTG